MNRVVYRYIMSDCNEKFLVMYNSEDDSEILVTGLHLIYVLSSEFFKKNLELHI